MEDMDIKLLEKSLIEFVTDIAGSQRQIDLDLISSLDIRSDFLESVYAERRKLFNFLVKDSEIDPEEYRTYDFGYLEDIVSNDYNINIIPEDTKTPLNSPTRRLMRKFRLPTHFYLWTLTWLDKGLKPDNLPPVVDLDILAKSKEYLKAETGLPTDTKIKLRQLFKQFVNSKSTIKKKKITQAIKDMKELFDKIPKNIYRKKPVIKELKNLIATKNKSYSDLAFDLISDTGVDMVTPENDKAVSKLANKLRKRSSYYKAK